MADGSGPYEGRLEVFFQGEWGTVCLVEELDYGQMPQTVCNQIGAGNWKASATRKFGPGVGRIWLEGIRCNGDENGIDSCKYPAWGAVTCDHSMDIGVKCGGWYSLCIFVFPFLLIMRNNHVNMSQTLYYKSWFVT